MPGPTTQNQYSQNTVACDGGLDFISPKINVNAGSLNGCLNFERTDRVGYSRIPGNEWFDGGMLASLTYTNMAYIYNEASEVTPPVRDPVWILAADDTAGPVMGFVIEYTDTLTSIVVTNFDEWRKVLAAVAASATITLATAFGATLIVDNATDYDITWKAAQSDPASIDAEDLVNEHNRLFLLAKSTETFPGQRGKPVIGLHGYKDQVYAIKDLRVLKFKTGTSQVFDNDLVKVHGDTDDHAFTILDVLLDSGAWGSTAAGRFLVNTTVSITNNTSFDIVRPTSTIANAFVIDNTGNTDVAWFAGMWRSTDYPQSVDESEPMGWNPVDLGYTTGFVDGQSNGPFRVARRGTFSNFDTDVITTSDFGTVGSVTDSDSGGPVPGDSWTLVNASTVPEALQAENGTAKFVQVNMNDTVAPNLYEPADIYISDFPAFAGFSSASSLKVQGVQVDVNVRGFPQNDGIRQMTLTLQPVTGDTTILAGTAPQIQVIPVNQNPPSQQTIQSLTFGGPSELWGLDAETLRTNMDSGFGFKVQPYIQFIDNLRSGRIDVLMVKVTVYYTATVTNYYFWNGSDDVTADITGFFVSDGDWSTNDAAGTIQLTNIQPYLTANRRTITDGDEVRTDPGGAGLLIATIDGDIAFNGLDTLQNIEDAESRYEMVTANFYADAEFEAMYGVSGAGRAWSYDGFYFDRIFTQDDATKDKPRHITDHQFHLALGYDSGAVLLSALGDPQNFNGLDGAAEIDTADPVHGFSKMQGTVLGVFCKKSIQGIVGTSIDNFSLTVLSPYEGAIEYTVLDIGKPVYCSYRGISFYEQTAAYGSFAGARLSTPITPWLLPRLQGTVTPIGTTASSFGPVCAVACRSKNQYRLYFGDGYRLTMTLTGSDQTPQFTFQADSEYNGFGIWSHYIVPRAETSFVDSKGSEHIYISHYSTSTVPPDGYYVYEYERSWTFNGFGIPAYLVLNENFYGGLFDIDNVRIVRAHGMSLGFAPLSITLRKDYQQNFDANQDLTKVIPLSLPRDPNALIATDYIPVTNIGNVASRGNSFNYRLMSYTMTNTPADSKDPLYATVCPPFIIQGLLVQNTENKGDL